jgi:hypothetical protein
LIVRRLIANLGYRYDFISLLQYQRNLSFEDRLSILRNCHWIYPDIDNALFEN